MKKSKKEHNNYHTTLLLKRFNLNDNPIGF